MDITITKECPQNLEGKCCCVIKTHIYDFGKLYAFTGSIFTIQPGPSEFTNHFAMVRIYNARTLGAWHHYIDLRILLGKRYTTPHVMPVHHVSRYIKIETDMTTDGLLNAFVDYSKIVSTVEEEIVEGKAVIVWVTPPSSFTPNVPFNIRMSIWNETADDWIFVRLIDRDTGGIIKEYRRYMVRGSGAWILSIPVTLPQTMDFHGRIEAGHET